MKDKLQRPYAPYTKTFDQKHMKTPYLRKWYDMNPYIFIYLLSHSLY